MIFILTSFVKNQSIMAEEEKKEEITSEAPVQGVDEAVDSVKEAVETAKESVKEITEETDVEMTAEQKKIVEQIEKMTVMDLNNLVKVFEKRFGVSATVVAPAGGALAGAEDGAEEQNLFNVELISVGDQKIQIIKIIKEVLGLGLKEAKDIMDGAPVMIKEGLKKDEAEELKSKIEVAGGKAELK